MAATRASENRSARDAEVRLTDGAKTHDSLMLEDIKTESDPPVRVQPVIRPIAVDPDTFNANMLAHLEKQLGRKPIPGRDYDGYNCIGDW